MRRKERSNESLFENLAGAPKARREGSQTRERLGQASEDYSRIEDARRHGVPAHHSRRVFNALTLYYHFIQTLSRLATFALPRKRQSTNSQTGSEYRAMSEKRIALHPSSLILALAPGG